MTKHRRPKPGDPKVTVNSGPTTSSMYVGGGFTVSVNHIHKCEMVARGFHMNKGRDWWIGRLTEKIEQWPAEKYCLHMKTPVKEVVFLLNDGDLYELMALCQSIADIKSLEWLDGYAKRDRAYGSGTPEEKERMHQQRLKNIGIESEEN